MAKELPPKEIKTKTGRTNFEFNITKEAIRVKRNLYLEYVVDNNL